MKTPNEMIWPFRRSAAISFRRTTGDTVMWLMNLTVAIGIGVVSGHYMFSEPLEQYWKEKRLQEANAIAAVKEQQQQQNQQQSFTALNQENITTMSNKTHGDVPSKTK